MSLLEKLLRKKKIIERSHRFKIRDYHDLSMAINGEEFEIGNLSLTGIGFKAQDLSEKLKTNEEILIGLRIGEHLFTISGRIAHITNGFIGLAVTSHLDEYAKIFKSFFDIEIKAIKLEKMDVSEIKHSFGGELHWYHSDQFHELIYVLKDGTLTYFKLIFQSMVIEMNSTGSLIACEYIADEANPQKKFEPLHSLIGDEQILGEMSPYLCRFINEINGLDEDLKSKLTSKIKPEDE